MVSDNYRLGRLSTRFVFCLEGFLTILIMLITGRYSLTTIAGTTVGWILGMILLLAVYRTTVAAKYLYLSLQQILSSVLGFWIIYVFNKPHMLFLPFLLQWMSNLLFQRKLVCRLLFLTQVISVSIFAFGFREYTLVEYTCAIIVLGCCCWFGEKLVEIVQRQGEHNAEHEQSLDDMLALVEVKFEEARNANRAKSAFLANMSHEIRTPINTVLGLDTMILRESGEEEIRKYAFDIYSAGQSLLSIINDILDFSKIESGRMEIIPVDYDLASLINDVTNMIQEKAQSKGLEFQLCVDSKMPSRLYGDDVRIRQVLVNLLTNAVKYTHQGSVTLMVGGIENDGHYDLFCSVKDTGIGIRPEDIDKLYWEFTRIDEKRNRNIEGTGLGINIVTQLLKLMGSKLEVNSVYGEGSNFFFSVSQGITNREPIGDLERRIREQATEYSYSALGTYPDARLLVVDDNAMNRLVFTKLLKDLQCVIEEADSGRKCLEMVEDTRYDIIFMDHMMPELDGVETLHEMQNMNNYPNKNTPVVALTANAIAGSREFYLAQGFRDYLTKPIIPEKLEKMIETLLNEAKYPEIEGIDWDAAIDQLQDIKLVQSVMTEFAMTADEEWKELQDIYLALRDRGTDEETDSLIRTFRAKLHVMKNATGKIGATKLSEEARALEYAAMNHQMYVINDRMKSFEENWKRQKAAIDRCSRLLR